MADDDNVITFATKLDPSGAQRDAAAMSSSLGSYPVRLPSSSLASVFPPPPGADPRQWQQMLGGIGTGGSGSASVQVQAAASQLAQAIQGAAQQVRAAAGAGGGGGSHGGGIGGVGIGLAAGGMSGGGGGAGGGGGPWTQDDLNSLAAIQANPGVGTAAGAARAAASVSATTGRRFGSGLSRMRGLFYSLGAYEGAHAIRGSYLAQAQAQYASTPSEALDASIAGVDASTSGVFGGIIGLGADALGGIGIGTGPSQVRRLAIEAKATATASQLARQDLRVTYANAQRTVAGGNQRYGAGAAEIENSFAEEQFRITSDYEDASNIQDAGVRSSRRLGLSGRNEASKGLRKYRLRNLHADALNEYEQYYDEGAVARGTMTRSQAGRSAIQRRIDRAQSEDDRDVAGAQMYAYESTEGYRIWQREYAAGNDYQQAADRYGGPLGRRPNVAHARGIYNRGILESENARREGSSVEAELIRRRTGLELGSFQRDLLEGGSGSEVQNGSLDIGQHGSPLLGVPEGMQSTNQGDDTGAALKKIADLLEALGVKVDDLNQWAKDTL